MNFKTIISIALLSIGTISCTSCAKKVPDPVVVDAQPPIPPDAGAPDVDAGAPDAAPDATPPKPNFTVRGEKWELTFPFAGWMELAEPPQHTVGYLNSEKKNLVIVVAEPHKGTFDEYALESIRAMRASGSKILSAKQVEVNATNFVLVESIVDNVQIWSWVTVKDGQGIGLSCGGPAEFNHHDLCFGLANTFKLN